MSKNDRRQEAPANPQEGNGSAAPDIEALISAQLAPVGEFRERAESWMKEITAQVARLAGRTEEEDRRKQAIDKRLADFEERMQSLLTLTELVSIDKNPFAGRPAPPAAATSPPSSSALPPPESGSVPSAEASAPAAEPAPAAPRDAPTGATPQAAPPAQDPPPAPRVQEHPNDAAAEPILLSDEDAPAPPRAPAPPVRQAVRPPSSNGTRPAPDAAARQRLTILEWSKLLAPQLERFDLGAFLGFYVESGWIDRDTAACVRNLAQQLRAARTTDDQPALTLDEVHARSILVLSHLDAQPVAADAAGLILREARNVTQGGWLTPTT